MELKEFLYDLPEQLIAAYPSRERQDSRLLVLERRSGAIHHSVFREIHNLLAPGDLVVLNDTKVFPARLQGAKESGGRVEVLLLERFPHARTLWIALVSGAKTPRVGSRILFEGDISASVLGDMGRGRFGLEFHHEGDFASVLQKLGQTPLPPYVTRVREAQRLDRERYQTVYAAAPGAIAAPTAGFHFTPELLEQMERKGIGRALLTLHVGPGTFQPVRERNVQDHRMEGERYVLGAEAAEKITATKSTGHRVVAVGSTSTRTLEWIASTKGRVQADEGIARLFIHPGDSFRVIDALVTNFHLPGSTPLLLVAAFAGMEAMKRAYAAAIEARYRFYSYGDAMLIL